MEGLDGEGGTFETSLAWRYPTGMIPSLHRAHEYFAE